MEDTSQQIMLEKFVNLLHKRKENRKLLDERVDAFFDFMQATGIDVDELSPKVVVEWLGYSMGESLKITEGSLDFATSLHSPYLWSDTHIKFERSASSGKAGRLVTHVKQELTPAARGWDIHLNYSGVFPQISQIKSIEDDRGHHAISFRDKDGLGFDLIPIGGVVFNFIGDRPRD